MADTYLLEQALPGDVALIEAWEGDRWGNLTYRSSARNFNPVMAMAAKLTIAQAQHIVELGTLDPEKVGTPGMLFRSRGPCAVWRSGGDMNMSMASRDGRRAVL